MVYNAVMKQAAFVKKELKSRGDRDVNPDVILPGTSSLLSEAYDRCGEVCAEYAKTFYLGTLLMTLERRRAIWAIYGTVGLLSPPVMGIAPESQAPTDSVYNAVLALGIANQLTNILWDVGEDAGRGRVYLPQDELTQAGLSDDDIFAAKVTEKWRNFMKNQTKRARMFFDEAEKGVTELSAASRWPISASLLVYRQILDEMEATDYNNFSKRAYVSKTKKIVSFPFAYAKSLIIPSPRVPSPSTKT